jgi:hypothetical protein
MMRLKEIYTPRRTEWLQRDIEEQMELDFEGFLEMD